jgi:cell division-specific peptidoglycan biosynthesis regulator FtsW
MKLANVSLSQQVSALALDRGLVLVVATLISIGLIMVASSSLDFAAAQYGDAWFL